MEKFGIAFNDGNFGFVIKTGSRSQEHDGAQNLFNEHRPPHHLNGHHHERFDRHHDNRMFNRPPHHLNGHHHERFDRHQLNNNYDNSCECENQGYYENYDFDNSDIERLLNGCFNNNSVNNNYLQNNLEDRLSRLENMIKNNQQPEKQENSLENRLNSLENMIKSKQPEKQENSLENRLNSLENMIKGKQPEKQENNLEDRLNSLENMIKSKKEEKDFEARMNQLKEDQKEAARRGFIGTPDKTEKKELPAPVTKTETKHEVHQKPKPKHVHKPIKKPAHKETSIHEPKQGDLQNYMLGSVKIEPANLKYESLFSKPIDTIKCH